MFYALRTFSLLVDLGYLGVKVTLASPKSPFLPPFCPLLGHYSEVPLFGPYLACFGP